MTIIAVLLSFSCLYIVSYGSVETTDDRPNILLLFPDEWRFDWADQYFIKNLSLHTPTFKSIVQNGTRFINTCVGSPLCAPSRSCIASGKEYDYTGVAANGDDYPKDEQTIYNMMQDAGYWVTVSGKDDLTKHTGCGIDGEYRADELGFNDQRRCKGKGDNIKPYPQTTDPYAVYLSEQYHVNANGTNETEWDISYDCYDHCCKDHACSQSIPIHTISYEDNYITQNTLNMMDSFPTTKPWFLQISSVLI